MLNIEGVLVDDFGSEYALAESLNVPLQLSGFRDPGVLSSRRKLQAALPPDVQAVLDLLGRGYSTDTEEPPEE